MKITELIAMLQAHLGAHGNLEVEIVHESGARTTLDEDCIRGAEDDRLIIDIS